MFRDKIVMALVLGIFVSCGSEKKQTDAGEMGGRKSIAVVNYPLYYFAKAIGGEYVQVYFPAIEGDPAYWRPSAKQVYNFQKSDLILANGAGYEKWMEKVSLPSSRVTVTSRTFKDQWISIREAVTHSHGPEGEHVHEGTAFTTWLNFKFALVQAAEVHKSIARLLPDKLEEINANFAQLQRQLEQLDQLAESVTQKVGNRAMLDAHGIYQYFASGYGLNLLSEHLEARQIPNEHQWHQLEEAVKDHNVAIMLWEDDPVVEISNRLDQMDVKIVVFDPCANRPEEGGFIDIMNQNLKELESAVHAL